MSDRWNRATELITITKHETGFRLLLRCGPRQLNCSTNSPAAGRPVHGALFMCKRAGCHHTV